MNTCKKCGKNVSLLSSICDECKIELEEIAKIEQKKLEEKNRLEKEEKLLKLTEDTKTLISDIVKRITKEEPLFYSFIHHDVEATKKNSMIGTVVGGALGGVVGAAMGGSFDSGNIEYIGNIGVLVVTKENIIINHFKTKLHFKKCISHIQLQELLREILMRRTLETTFKINLSQVYYNKIISRNIDFNYGMSDIYLDNTNIFNIPQQKNFVTLCENLGSLITVDDCIEKLREKVSPMNEYQFESVSKNNKKYIDDLFDKIVKHSKRNEIAENFVYLTPSLRKQLVSKLIRKAKTTYTYLLFSIIFVIFSVYLVIMIKQLFLRDDGGFTYQVLAMLLSILLMFIIAGTVELIKSFNKAIWCRNVFIFNQMNKDDYLTAPSQ